MPEQAHYDQVSEELRNEQVIDGLWTRAFAEATGDTQRARAIYIQLRAAQLAGSSYTPPSPPAPAQAVSQVRPWVRYWARLIDIFLFCLCAGFVIGIVAPQLLTTNDLLMGVLFTFAWCFVEPIFLSSWGATPGKALLRVSVRNSDGSLLDYGSALSRSFDVWFRGLGIGIPLVTLFTHLAAYNTLTKNGITSWDSSRNLRVVHDTIGSVRVFVAVVFVVLFVGFASLAKSA